jgi:glutaminyl-peptide cyclotransferase
MHRRIVALAVVATGLCLPSFAVAGGTPATTSPAEGLPWEVISRRPHDTDAFTEGLVLDQAGRLFESTGRYGRSSLREVDPVSGDVLRSVALTDDQFGEGIAQVGDRLVQLTWREGEANSWDIQSFELEAAFDYDGEGWGLCHDGVRLVMSDGSDRLTFRDDQTFGEIGSIGVTLDGVPRDRLNELECVDGAVWANVWGSDLIVRIDPATGIVDGVLDLHGILQPHPTLDDPTAVLNGIAYDPLAGTFLVTGKDWPELIEIRIDQGD